MADNKNITQDIVLQLNKSIQTGFEANKLDGFAKAYTLAEATRQLKDLLVPEYMRPILELQGSKLGFKTDKDDEGGYPEKIVKNCLIEAVLTGVQVVGNHFNIIRSNCYITKEGFGYLLANMPNLSYEIIPKLPRINTESTSAAIVMQIKWSLNGGANQTREIDFPIKMNKSMGTDAVIGKATRKARAWLYNNLSGLEVSDGDIMDIKAEILENGKLRTSEKSKSVDEKNAADEKNRLIKHIENASLAELDFITPELLKQHNVEDVFNFRKEKLLKETKPAAKK